MPDQATDKRLELAYDAAEKKLAMQDATLGHIRMRANNLLATAALFTSFSAGVGLINTDRSKGPVLSPCAGAVLLAVVILLGLSALVAIWPVKEWHFVPSAKIIMDKIDAQETEDAIRRFVADGMVQGAVKNQTQLKRKQNAFHVAAVLLAVEVALLVGLLIAR